MSGSHIKSQGIRNIFICLNSDSLSHRSFSSIHSCKINRNKFLDLQYIMLKTLLFWFLVSKHTELRIMSTQLFSSVVLFVCLFVCVLFALLYFVFCLLLSFFCHTHGVHIPTLECQHSSTSDSFFLCRFIGPYSICLCCCRIPPTAMSPLRMFYFTSTQN